MTKIVAYEFAENKKTLQVLGTVGLRGGSWKKEEWEGKEGMKECRKDGNNAGRKQGRQGARKIGSKEDKK